MSSAGSMIQASLERIRAYAPGQSMGAASSSRGLDQLNKYLDSLSNESLACYAKTTISFQLVPLKTQYTIGLTGSPDINATRPLRLLEGAGMAYSLDANGNRYPIEVVPQTRWNVLGNVTDTTQSTTPTIIFYDPQYPLGTINVYPSPTEGFMTYVTAYMQLAQMTNLTQEFSLPPGYELMIETGLAIQMWPFFKSGDPPASLVRMATNAKRNVKRTNQNTDEAMIDPALTNAPGFYDVYTDSYRAS